jgi:hypothetical protein
VPQAQDFVDAWKLDRERAPTARLALHGHGATVRFDDATHQMQSEAAALNLT